MAQQTVQLLAIFGVLLSFGVAELIQGRFFAPEATREDNRLDIAVTLLFPLISASVLAASTGLCTWLMPEQRQALAAWPVWQMLRAPKVAVRRTACRGVRGAPHWQRR